MKETVSNCMRTRYGLFGFSVMLAALFATSALAQNRARDIDVRMEARHAVLAEMDRKYGRAGDTRMNKIYAKDMSGDDRRVTGDGTYLVGRDRREFTFECFVDTRNGRVRDLKIHSEDVTLDFRELGAQAALEEIRSRHGRDSRPRNDKVYAADFDKHEKRVYGNGFYRDGGHERTYRFECLVNMYSGQVRRMKIDEREERPGGPGRPGREERPGPPDRDTRPAEGGVRDVVEAAVTERLKTEGVEGRITFSNTKVVESRRDSNDIEGDGSYRTRNGDKRFHYTCTFYPRSNRVDRLQIENR